MTKTNTIQKPSAKRLSPELAEVLHMLKSLETQTPPAVANNGR